MNFKDKTHIEIRFGGYGGQGLVLASIIMAEALIEEGYNIIQGQSHGIEARGSTSRGELIASKEEIYDLMLKCPDIFLALSDEACNKYYDQIKKDALVILDSSEVKNVPPFHSKNVYAFPITQLLRDKFDNILPANICFLGAIVGLTGITSAENMKSAILKRVPKTSQELNTHAYNLGLELASSAEALQMDVSA
jgi:2-oxoglutarate ferredoxin oxidoreductase subunit gamma